MIVTNFSTELTNLNAGAFAAWYSSGCNSVKLAHAMRAAIRSPYFDIQVPDTDLIISYRDAEGRKPFQSLAATCGRESHAGKYFSYVGACGFIFCSAKEGKLVDEVTMRVANNLRYAEGLQVMRVRKELAEWKRETGDDIPLLLEVQAG